MSKVVRALKLAVANIAIFALMLAGLIVVLSVGGDAFNLAKTLFPKSDRRASLPVYEDKEKALQIFRDQKGSIKNYVPFIEWRHAEWHSPTLNIDEDGYRTHAVGRNNRPDAQTIAFFGGSTIWGTGVDDNGTIPAQFDDLGDTFDVMNIGERAFSSTQNLIEFVTLLNTNRVPRVVVFYQGFNDIWIHCNRAVTSRLNGHMEERRIQSALDRTEKKNYSYNNLIVPLMVLIGEVTGDDDGTVIPGCSNDPQRARQVAELIVQNFELARVLSESVGSRFLGVLQPNAYYGSPTTEYLGISGERVDAWRKEFAAVYPLVRGRLRIHENGWFLDLSQALDSAGPVLIDHAHLIDRGNRLIAEAILDRLEKE